jgi:putative PIN family toxin of toxin-antitoxin system
MRLVLDVNVWISGLLWGGSPRQIVNLAKAGKITIFVSEPILSELAEVLVRVKFRQE